MIRTATSRFPLRQRLASIAVMTAMMLTVSSLQPRKAHALVGLLTGNVALIVIGGGMFLGGALAMQLTDDNESDKLASGIGIITLIGLVLLDAKSTVSPHYSAVTAAQARSIGMSADESAAYNHELGEINMISNTITADTMQFNHKDEAGTTPAQISAFIRDGWKSHGQALSPDAFAGLKKVQGSIVSTLSAKRKS